MSLSYRLPYIRLSSLLLLFLAACGGDSGPPDDGNQNPPPGGNPAGDPVTAQIGPAGGTIGTADGGISLVFPSGALAANTEVTIRPVVNSAPGGVGVSYKIEPAGLAIAQPVHLTLGVTAAQLGDGQIEELGVGLRDKAGTWFTDMNSSPAAAVRTGAPGGGASRLMDGGAVDVTLSNSLITETTVVTFWRVLPRRPKIKTTEHVTLTVEACFQETENTSYWNEDGVTITSRRRTRTCGPSVRQGTWSVESLTGQTGSGDVGTVAVGNPTSVATYTAPTRHPPGGAVVVTAHLYWAEMNVTSPIPILVQVEQSNEWGGTWKWSISGEDVVNIHNDSPYIDQTTTTTREGSGEIQLRVIPGRANPAVAVLDPSSIIGTDHIKIVIVTITKNEACTATLTETTDARGNIAEFPSEPPPYGPGGIAILFEEGNKYAIGFYSPQWEGTATVTSQRTVVCAGDDDPLPGLPTSFETTYTMGPEISGGFGTPDGLYHTTLNPAAPQILEGTASWKDGVMDWATTKVEWSITRPQ